MFFNVGGVQLFAEVAGKGQAIVCLHGGFGLDHSYFRPGIDALSTDHQLVLADLRGHGRSDQMPREAFRIGAVVTDLEAIREKLGHTSWAVLGHSGGGLVAAQYAVSHPNHVSHLILVGSFPKFPFRATRWLQLAHELGDPDILSGLEMFIDGVTTDEEYREAYLKIAPLLFADPKGADITPFKKVVYRVAPFLEASSFHAGLDMGPTASTYKGPVLVLHGADDHRVPTSEGKKWLRYLPQARWIEIGNAGHFPFIERPDIVCDAIRQTLKEV